MTIPLKASRWWDYKVPPILAIAYLALSLSPSPPPLSQAALPLLLLVIAVIGMSGFGHLITDAFDVGEDRLLGKPNLWAPLSNARRAMSVALLLAASWIPWAFLPGRPLTLILVALELAVFFLYAAPPVRLKERGLAGALADSMYAHVLPLVWTWVPFVLLSRADAPAWMPVLLAAWAAFVGLRHILMHQNAEVEGDARAGVGTFAVRHGRERTASLIALRLLPVEFLLFGSLIAVIGIRMPIVAIGFVGYLAIQLLKLRFAWRSRYSVFRGGDNAHRAELLGSIVLSRFYERWLAPLILLGIAVFHPAYLILLVIHLVVFRRAVGDLLFSDIPAAAARFGNRRPRMTAQ